MIILASDEVGFQAVGFLVNRGQPLDVLGLDPADRGGFNLRIRQLVQAKQPSVRIIETSDWNAPQLISSIAASSPAMGVLAWWPYILTPPLLTLPPRGWLNFHPSLLPYNRGKHPNFWTLVDETPAGVTLHWIDAGVDSGAVVAQATVDVSWLDTGETLYRRCQKRIVQLFEETFDDIVAGRLTARPQSPTEGTFHHSRELDPASRIELDRSYTARRLLNILRARTFPPHPGATFTDQGKTYTVRISITEEPAS